MEKDLVACASFGNRTLTQLPCLSTNMICYCFNGKKHENKHLSLRYNTSPNIRKAQQAFRDETEYAMALAGKSKRADDLSPLVVFPRLWGNGGRAQATAVACNMALVHISSPSLVDKWQQRMTPLSTRLWVNGQSLCSYSPPSHRCLKSPCGSLLSLSLQLGFTCLLSFLLSPRCGLRLAYSILDRVSPSPLSLAEIPPL